MQISHHGAVNGVVGPCHQSMIDSDNSLLVDCGLFQDADTSGRSGDYLLALEFELSTVLVLLVTHCHIGHVGRIPYFLATDFSGDLGAIYSPYISFPESPYKAVMV